MANHPRGVYQIGTVTVGASGIETVNPVQSNSVYRNLSINLKPEGAVADVRYRVTVLMNGEVEEEHTYPSATDRVIYDGSFPNKLFPPNVGANNIPGFLDASVQGGGVGKSLNPLGVSLQIENLEGTPIEFTYWSTFEEFDMVHGKLLGDLANT
jgi:hypothetical protein